MTRETRRAFIRAAAISPLLGSSICRTTGAPAEATLRDKDIEALFVIQAGRGYDTVFDQLRVPLFNEPPLRLSFIHSTTRDAYVFEKASNQSSYSNTVTRKFSIKGSYGKASASVAKESERFFSSDSYSVNLIGRARMNVAGAELDLRKLSFQQDVKSFMENANSVEHRIGDRFVSGVLLGAELFVRYEMRTKSDAHKEELSKSLSASYSSFGSADKAVKQINTSKKIISSLNISVFGDFSSAYLPSSSVEEVQELLKAFPGDVRSSTPHILNLSLESFSNLPVFLNAKSFVDRAHLVNRTRYIRRIEDGLQNIQDWIADIEYVTSPENKDQFAPETRQKAEADLVVALELRHKLEEAFVIARATWEEMGVSPTIEAIDGLPQLPTFTNPRYERLGPPLTLDFARLELIEVRRSRGGSLQEKVIDAADKIVRPRIPKF